MFPAVTSKSYFTSACAIYEDWFFSCFKTVIETTLKHFNSYFYVRIVHRIHKHVAFVSNILVFPFKNITNSSDKCATRYPCKSRENCLNKHLPYWLLIFFKSELLIPFFFKGISLPSFLLSLSDSLLVHWKLHWSKNHYWPVHWFPCFLCSLFPSSSGFCCGVLTFACY